MDLLADFATTLVEQFQKPTLSFLLGGMLLAALGSKLEVPAPVYKFIVLVLLLKVGLGAGISVREADLVELAVPALLAAGAGVLIVFLGSVTLVRWRNVAHTDGTATVGLFGAVSASTLAAGMAILEVEGIQFEGFVGALYPFMDVAALVTAIVLARIALARRQTASDVPGNAAILTMERRAGLALERGLIGGILSDTFKSPAISALALGLFLGIFARPESVYEGFYEPLFRGLLSILMLIMGMEAWSRLSELKGVAHAYLAYAVAAPLVHGALGFGLGLVAHELTGFSAGGVILLAVMASSSSDISGPPTMRGALPEANPSAYIGSSTGIGTPVALLSIPIWIALADAMIGFR